MEMVTIDGLDLAFERRGQGPPLLFLNGSGATMEGSALLHDLLARDFDVVLFDQRGIGSSALPADLYDMATLAADALSIADHLGWERFRLAGMSFGGMVAQELAVSAPERIERLALLCTSSGGSGGSSYPLHIIRGLDPEAQAAQMPVLLDTRFSAEWLTSHPDDRSLLGLGARDAAREKPAAVRKGEVMQLEARRHHDVYDRLPRITAPTLVAAGRFDGIAPLANSEAIAAQIPDATMRIYEGGHLFLVQDKTAFGEIVEFLQA